MHHRSLIISFHLFKWTDLKLIAFLKLWQTLHEKYYKFYKENIIELSRTF